MIDINCFESLVNQAVSKLPKKIFEHLNLGIGIVEHAASHTKTGSGKPAYILGEYHVRHSMGRGIVLYYGSFTQVYPTLTNREEALQIIDKVIRHELTHHLESLAGDRSLEAEDARRLLEM